MLTWLKQLLCKHQFVVIMTLDDILFLQQQDYFATDIKCALCNVKYNYTIVIKSKFED